MEIDFFFDVLAMVSIQFLQRLIDLGRRQKSE
jgi:hypothetical protein